MAVLAATNTDSGQTWVKTGSTGTPLWTAASALPGLMAKGRGKRPTHLVISPQTWDQVTGTLDGSARPLLPPKPSRPSPTTSSTCRLPDPRARGPAKQLRRFLDRPLGEFHRRRRRPLRTAPEDGYSVVLAVRAPDLLLFQWGAHQYLHGRPVRHPPVAVQDQRLRRGVRRPVPRGRCRRRNGGDVTGTICAGARHHRVVKAFETAR